MSIDLSVEYLGLQLNSPIVASASPCTGQPDVLQRLEACGAGAAVLPSLFEEQFAKESREVPTPGELSEFPPLRQYNRGAENYLMLVEQARDAVSMPIIGSLNGATLGGWLECAKQIEDAGVNALELNVHYVPTDGTLSSQSIEAQYLDVIAAVRKHVQLPLAVKIGPYFSSLPYFARQAVEAGADGLVLFNRFLEPEINLDESTIDTHLALSRPGEERLSIRWVGILRDQLPDCSLAASAGFHTGKDVLKALAVGADVVMITSVLLKNGAEYLETLHGEMVKWLSTHDFSSLRRLIGTMSRGSYGASEVFERANYAATLASYLDHGAVKR